MTTIQIIGIIALALLGGFIFYCLYDIQKFNRSNKKKLILLALVSLTGQQAMATEYTVTYRITETHNNNAYTFNFERTGSSFGTSYGSKTAYVSNINSTTGFNVELDDGLTLQLSMDQGQLAMQSGSGDYIGLILNNTGDLHARIIVSSSRYYVTHVRIANPSDGVLVGNAHPWTVGNDFLDLDVDMVTQSAPNSLSDYKTFNTNFGGYRQTFAQLTITYSDSPRPYSITYTNAVNGENGVTNPNPTTYNVITPTFTVNEPTRTGYTLDGITYTDAQITPPITWELPRGISRGYAAMGKDITYNFTWTANQYAVTLDQQSGSGGTTAVTATYDAAMPDITVPTRTGHTFGGYYTETNGGGTQYYNADGISAHNWDITEATTLYAQWTANTYTVHFDANYDNNGIVISGTMSDQNFTYDQGVLNANAFTRTGYTFVNWNTQADGNGTTYTNQQASPNITPDDGATMTLYAQWSVIDWTGSGDSEQDPYLILYASQLIKISNDVNGKYDRYINKFFKLGNDIDMNGVAFEGIGTGSSYFCGNFNGDGKTISNVTVNLDRQFVGFFNYVYYGTFRNLIFDGASITGICNVGVLIGEGYHCSIENCLVMNSSVTYSNTLYKYVGAICGHPYAEATLTGNYYHNCTLTNGNNTSTTNIGVGDYPSGSTDVDGARSVHTLTLPEHFTATSTETVTYNQVTYYASNVEVTLTLEQGCYITDDVTVNGTPATENDNGTWSFIMPAADAIVSATVMEYKITVNDDTNTNPNVPFSSQYCKQGAHSQFIIPAADLTDMQWGAIHKMTFFSNTASVSWDNVEYNVYFAEVDFTTFEDGDWISGSSIIYDYHGKLVYSSGVSVSDNKMEITLDTLYPYYGGNLWVYFEEDNYANNPGSDEMTWYGKTQTGNTAVYQYQSNNSGAAQFLPKITFGYIPAPSCIPPTALTVGEVTNHTAAISWTPINGETEWHVYCSTDPTAPDDDIDLDDDDVIAVTTTTHTFTGLDASTKYYFWVRGNCDDDGYSSWAGSDFTTEIACAAPTRLNVSNIASTSATLGWTSDGDNFNVTYAELPVASSEYKYDNDVYESCVPNRYAGILLPAGSYTESNIRKISVYDSYMATGAVCPLWICYGTTAPDMANPIYTDSVIFAGVNAMIDIPINVAVDNAQNLWVVMHSDGDRFSLPICTDHSDGVTAANGRWYSENGSKWSNNDYWEKYYVWMIRVTLDEGGYNWSDITSTTNSSYTITGLNANKDYAVRVRKVCGDDDGESSWSGTCFSTRIKAFTTAGDWANACNWSPKGVPTINDNVVICADAIIGSGCVAQAHQITFEGTPTPTLTLADGGQLVCDNPANVTVQKTIKAYSAATGPGNTDGWYFIASPVSEDFTPTSTMLSNTYDLYRLNPDNTMWENFKNSAHSDFETLTNGQGYLYANSADVTLSFTGTTKPYNNRYGVPLSAGWNLVGNPYTFDAYVNCVYYRMKSTRKEVEFVNENFPIPPCESVLIEVTADSSVVFTNVEQPWQENKAGHLNIALTKVVEPADPDSRFASLRGTKQSSCDGPSTGSGALLDKAVVSFNEGSQLGKFYFGTQDANIYIPQNGKDYAIAHSEKSGEMPLNFKAAKNGTYTLSINTEDVDLGYLHLIDNLTGADVDLLAGCRDGVHTVSTAPTYTFTAKTTDYESRFRLVFVANNEDGPLTGSASDETFAFFSNGNWIIANEGRATLQVIDVNGRILSNEEINGSVSKGIDAASGVYLLRLVSGDSIRTQKIVVR